jgi:hypothetical protein
MGKVRPQRAAWSRVVLEEYESRGKEMSEYIEFAVTDEKRFQDLQRFFNKLKADKDEEGIGDDEGYLALIDEAARKYYVWATPEENTLWAEKWFATPIETRFIDPSLKRGWDFGSMIDAFRNGEYSLLSCKLVSSNTARLNFYAHAYPYGGTGCMQALIESFGFKILMIADGGSPPHPP